MSESGPSGVPSAGIPATRSWEALADRIEAFVVAWESGHAPPCLADFLPESQDLLRRLALVELIKVDLEYRWLRHRLPRQLAEYFQDFPELAESVPADLIYEEFHIRRQAGDAVSCEEYLQRYSNKATELARLLGTQQPYAATVIRGSKPPGDVDVGQQLDDFELLVMLGRGAFASVFLARQRSMQRLVALKVSRDKSAEPETLAQLEHPHIVRVYDQRLLPERKLRLLYMQYVPGGTLEVVLDHMKTMPRRGWSGKTFLAAIDRALEIRGEEPPAESSLREKLASMTWPEVVCWLGARLASALDYAHQRGVLHRDLKPANVLLTAEGSPKLADFNVSCCSKVDGASPTAYFGGSLPYMSLEQLEAFSPSHPRPPDSLDGRSDLYSLGVLLWELLTGHRPLPDESMDGGWGSMLDRLMEQRRTGIHPRIVDQLPPGCPAGLDRLLLMCLAANPPQRPASGAELARQLELCLQPQTQSLLHTPARSWRRPARRFLIPAMLIAATIPNLLAAVFNFAYNREEIVARLAAAGNANAEAIFFQVQGIINAVAFPLGMVMVSWYAWPVSRALQAQHSGKLITQNQLRWLRQRCLRLGQFTALLGIAEWLLAGVAYPVSMHLATGHLELEIHLHFLASLALCGLIAAAYPFFLITFLAARVWYPPLLPQEAAGGSELRQIDHLRRWTWFYLALAASVPMLGVTLLVFVGSETGGFEAAQSANRLAMAVLCACGLAGFALVLLLARLIQKDLDALMLALQPLDTSARGESFTSTWGSKRK